LTRSAISELVELRRRGAQVGSALVPLDLALRVAFSSSSTLVYYAVARRRRTWEAP